MRVRMKESKKETERRTKRKIDGQTARQTADLREQFVDSEIVSGLQNIFLFGLQVERRFCFVRFGGTETPRSENNVSRAETLLAKKAQHCKIEIVFLKILTFKSVLNLIYNNCFLFCCLFTFFRKMRHSTLRIEIKEELTLVVFEVQTSTINNRKFEVEKRFL